MKTKLIGMRFIFTTLLSFGVALGMSAQNVILLENTDISGPVKNVITDDTAANNFSDSEAIGTIQTTSYDRMGKMLENGTQYYEGSSETRYEYVGNCVRRVYDNRGYENVSELIDVHFPDKNCNNSQIIHYSDRKVTGRTVISKSGSSIVEKTFRQDNTVSSTKTTSCTSNSSECTRQETTDEGRTNENWTVWPSGKLKSHITRQDYNTGTWTENSNKYNDAGRLIDSVYSYRSSESDSNRVYIRHNTYRYVKDDRYGNWKTRQVFRVIQKFGKSSEALELTTNRTFTYY